MADPGPRPEDRADGAPVPARLPQLLLTVLLSLLVVAAVVASVVAGGASEERAAGNGVQSPQALADALAGAAPGAGTPLDERVAPDAHAPLPAATLEPFADGPARRLGDYAGTPLVVNFWASWCGPCVDEMPSIDAVAERVDDVAFLGVNRDDQARAAEALVADLGVDYDLATDAEDALFPAVGGFGMPTTLLVDATGIIRYRHTGALDASELTDLLDRELGIDVPDAAANPASSAGPGA